MTSPLASALVALAIGGSVALASGWLGARLARRIELARAFLCAGSAACLTFAALAGVRWALPSSPDLVVVPATTAGFDWVSADPGRFPWATVFAWLWGAGAAVGVARILAGQIVVRGWLRRARVADAAFKDRVSAAAFALGVRTPRLLVSDDVVGPVAVGVRRPAVLWPSRSTGRATGLDAVLLHETVHCAERDPLWAWIAGVCRALFWWNPLSWAVVRRLHLASELCADRAVIRGGVRPNIYLRQLVGAADDPAPTASAVLGFRRSTGCSWSESRPWRGIATRSVHRPPGDRDAPSWPQRCV